MHQRRLSFGKTRQKKNMENLINFRSRYPIWCLVFALFGAWYLLLYIHDWSSLPGLTIFLQSHEDSARFTLFDVLSPTSNQIAAATLPSISNSTEEGKPVEPPPAQEKFQKKQKPGSEFESTNKTLPHEGTEGERIGKPESELPNRRLPRNKTTNVKIKKVDPKPEFEHANNTTSPETGIGKDNLVPTEKKQVNPDPDTDPDPSPCSGRYIYVHNIPRQFNEELTEKCWLLNKWINMCQYMDNMGLGQRLPGDRAFSRTGWFSTNQFSLEVIFHNRMKQYECLTNDSSKASAIFVPYYAGLDVARYLWGGYSVSTRDSGSLELYKWLRDQSEWKTMSGRDHFLVAGRITWDFRRGIDEDPAWGNKLMLLPESQNITMLTIESSPWNMNDFAIPYPTYFHPSIDADVLLWQARMRRLKRRFLFSFAGAPRPNMDGSIRGEIMQQCAAARRRCLLLECLNSMHRNRCLKPNHLMRMFQSSEFCLQPPGDSFTRRSTFDSIIAGCIPVFFHPGSAYVQYLWHLPKNFNKYSVLISEEDVRNKKAKIEEELMKIPRAKVVAMREEVIKLIPKVIYANPRSKLEKIEDAFDLTVKGVLNRVEQVRKEMREGRNSSEGIDEEMSWKYKFYGSLDNNEWDHYFERTNNYRYS